MPDYRTTQNGIVGAHVLGCKHSAYEHLSRAVYMEIQANLTAHQIAEWHGLTVQQVEKLAMDYLESLPCGKAK
jgi:hypothetical protein